MNDLMITTMPIKPYEKINIGLMIAPTLCDILGSTLNCKKVLAFNLLHSFEDKNVDLKNYIKNIQNFDIEYNEIIKDIEKVDEYLNKIEQLCKKQIISIKKTETLKCNCGKVEMIKKSIKDNKEGELYHWEDGKIICNFCHNECKEYKENNLFLEIRKEFCNNISISPIFAKKEINDLANKFIGQHILISKSRQNNYYIQLDGQKFNLDIDMLWMMFNQVELSKKQILIASNHQLYEMFISNYINNIFNEKKVHYIATPYLTNNENINFSEKIFSKDNATYKKLSILYSLKWKYKTLNWNNGILELLNKLSNDELKELYNLIINIPYDADDNIESIINSLFSNINLANNTKVLKRGK